MSNNSLCSWHSVTKPHEIGGFSSQPTTEPALLLAAQFAVKIGVNHACRVAVHKVSFHRVMRASRHFRTSFRARLSNIRTASSLIVPHLAGNFSSRLEVASRTV